SHGGSEPVVRLGGIRAEEVLFHCWLPVADSPEADPYRMLTAPASVAIPTSLNGTPTARFLNPAPLKSPVASAQPNRSAEASRADPVAVSSQNWLEVADNPVAE